MVQAFSPASVTDAFGRRSKVSLNVGRVRRYRDRHPRIDFYPSPDVLAILLHYKKRGTDPTLAGILDGLIRIGHRFVSGNGKN